MHKKRVVIFAIIVCCLAIYCFMPSSSRQLSVLQHYLGDMHTFVQNHYLLSVIAFILFFIGMILCMIPITVLLSLLSGYLYGMVWGTVYAVVSAVIGNVCVVFFIRRYGFTLLKKFQLKGSDYVNLMVIRLRGKEVWFVIAANLLPITPGPLITFAVSLSQMPLSLYAIACTIGLIPGTFMYALAGQQLYALSSTNGLVSTWVLCALTICALGILLYGVIKLKNDPRV